MKKVWLGILATLLLALFVAPAFAWEFSMAGEFEWRQNYLSRMGNKDIFGDAVVQETGINPPGTYIGFAGPNVWGSGFNATVAADDAASSAVRITRGGYSTWGCDAWIGDQRLTFRPTIQVNRAIRIHGVYTVGGLRDKYNQTNAGAGYPPYERYYMHHTSQAAYNTAAIGSWEQVRATIQLPIGTLSIGIKDFPFGTGMSFAENSRTDSALLVVPYGPFRFLFAVWPGLQAPGLGTLYSYNTRPDRELKMDYQYGPLVTYENGPLWIGFGGIFGDKHLMRQYAPDLNSADIFDWRYVVGFKYNNGRFFMNAEANWRNQDIYPNYAPNIVPLLGRGLSGERHTIRDMYMAEGGVLIGPAKITGMFGWTTGQVLPGVNPTLATSTFNMTNQYSNNSFNYQVLQPYSFLMFPTYGGGNNVFNADGTGEMGGSYCLAARADYAAAANLNLWGSYIWAHRTEAHGYYAGSFQSTGATAATAVFANIPTGYPTSAAAAAGIANAQAFKAQYGGGGNMSPFVDDGFVGWEAQAGLDWKLLENLSMQAAYSYWQLGPWFDQAYQAFTGLDAGGNGLRGGGILVGRDPIQSVRGSFTITF